jgi:hypothetical protein
LIYFEDHQENTDISIYCTGTFLSGSHITLYAEQLQVYTNLFALYGGSSAKAWSVQGRLVVD